MSSSSMTLSHRCRRCIVFMTKLQVSVFPGNNDVTTKTGNTLVLLAEHPLGFYSSLPQAVNNDEH